MAFRRMMAPAVYRREPLENLVYGLVGEITFRDLKHRLLINTTDLHSGMQVLWGLPGLLDTRVAEAVLASLRPSRHLSPARHRRPGLRGRRGGREPPGADRGGDRRRGRSSRSTSPPPAWLRSNTETAGFAATYIRGLEIVDADPDRGPAPQLAAARRSCWCSPGWSTSRCSRSTGPRSCSTPATGPRPRPWTSSADRLTGLGRGMHPTRRLRVLVDEERCVGCGTCVMQAPTVFRLDARGKGGGAHAAADLVADRRGLSAQLPDLRHQRASGRFGGVTWKMNTAALCCLSGSRLRTGLR